MAAPPFFLFFLCIRGELVAAPPFFCSFYVLGKGCRHFFLFFLCIKEGQAGAYHTYYTTHNDGKSGIKLIKVVKLLCNLGKDK